MTAIISVAVPVTVILVAVAIMIFGLCIWWWWTRYKVHTVKGSNESMYHDAGKGQKSIMKPSDSSVMSGVKDLQTVSTRRSTDITVQQTEDSLLGCENTLLHVCNRLQERERTLPFNNEAVYPSQNIAERFQI